jgi:hypothetical protein
LKGNTVTTKLCMRAFELLISKQRQTRLNNSKPYAIRIEDSELLKAVENNEEILDLL